MKDPKKLNGSVDLLAEALRGVVKEAVEEATTPVLEVIADSEERLINKIDETAKMTNENMQAQFAKMEERLGKVEKDIAELRS